MWVRYRNSPAVETELSRLVAEERRCCGDADIAWDLEIDEPAGEATLRIGVPPALRGTAAARIVVEVIAADLLGEGPNRRIAVCAVPITGAAAVEVLVEFLRERAPARLPR